MRKLTLSLLTAALITVASNASAWWGGGWNPYDPWDPRYWMEEFFGGGYYGGGPWLWRLPVLRRRLGLPLCGRLGLPARRGLGL